MRSLRGTGGAGGESALRQGTGNRKTKAGDFAGRVSCCVNGPSVPWSLVTAFVSIGCGGRHGIGWSYGERSTLE